MVSPRRGTSRLGCLLTLAIVGVVLYYGSRVAEIYWRFYRYQDALKEEARFGDQTSDEEIRRTLNSVVDTLALPDAARNIDIERRPHHILISAPYSEYWDVPYFGRDLSFTPFAEKEF